jgi:hypothetical protein
MAKIEINNLNKDDVEEMTAYALREGGCTICGSTEYPIHAEGRIGKDDDIENIFVCSFCMDVCGFDHQLERHARDLETRAEWLRKLIGKLVVMPGNQAWRDACKARTTENRGQYFLRLKEQKAKLAV